MAAVVVVSEISISSVLSVPDVIDSVDVLLGVLALSVEVEVVDDEVMAVV